MRIYVFVGKKLISTDTIVPVLAELKSRKPQVRVVVMTPDTATLNAIKNNVTLFHFIKSNCQIKNLGGLDKNKLVRTTQKISWVCQLFFIFLQMLCGAAKTIHFGLLEHPPRSWITKFNKRKIYYVESNGWGTGDLHLKFISNSRSVKPAPVITSSDNLVSFSDNWPTLFVPKNRELNHFSVTKSKLWPAWNNYLEIHGKVQWLDECNRLGIPRDKPILSYLLGTFDELPTLNTGETDDLVIDTLINIEEITKSTAILLKPHAITDLKRLNKILQTVRSENVHITYLHPSLLARQSLAVICNYYSTAIADYWYQGVTTIEFTRYSGQLLDVTGGRSFGGNYIDHFLDISEIETLKRRLKICFEVDDLSIGSLKQELRLSNSDELFVNTLI